MGQLLGHFGWVVLVDAEAVDPQVFVAHVPGEADGVGYLLREGGEVGSVISEGGRVEMLGWTPLVRQGDVRRVV